ncbi:hypothetical protein Rifp1Sym_bq00050 [endosymbiont of Riftia pachyptila (vent Ph05)]|jgi:hypothetical protein|uniref:Uncharacterized protein n=3 Tax=Gammaproteobacteria TaxID=1236 RepID=G2DDQ6_9GAMM|nr:hypothetical protein Rifp1Sym_bq00050 [endosymbiont of Riftia pachyptila (vent Ph05)]
MNEAMNTIFQFVGYLAALAAGAFVIAKILIRSALARNLASHKTRLWRQQQQEMNDHKRKVDALFRQATRIHERELDALSGAWGRLINAMSSAELTMEKSETSIDFDGISNDKLAELMDGQGFSDRSRKLLMASDDKRETYLELRRNRRVELAFAAVREFHEYVQKNSIFLGNDLKELFIAIDKMLMQAIAKTDWELGFELPAGWTNPFKQLVEELQPQLDELSGLIQKHIAQEKMV